MTETRAAREYISLLVGIEAITDELIDAASKPDIPTFEKLLQSRQLYLDELSAFPGEMPDFNRPDLAAVRDRILKKQEDCEGALMESLKKCRMDLLSFRKHKALRSAYNAPSVPKHARFLDSRL